MRTTYAMPGISLTIVAHFAAAVRRTVMRRGGDRRGRSWVKVIDKPLRRTGLKCFLETLTPSDDVVLNAQIDTIRKEIRGSGESIVDCHKLLLLCPDVSTSGQWGEIAKMAMAERWSFTFYADGDVRFANL